MRISVQINRQTYRLPFWDQLLTSEFIQYLNIPQNKKESAIRKDIKEKIKNREAQYTKAINKKRDDYKEKKKTYDSKMAAYNKNPAENDRKRKIHDKLYDERINNLNEAYVALLRKSKNPESPAQKRQTIEGFA